MTIMSRFTQNFMYAVIFVAIFAACIYFFTFNKNYEAKGVYLPNTEIDLPDIKPSDVKVYNLRYRSDTEGSIGLIRTSIHVNNEKDFQKLCDKDLNKAIELAAQNGVDEIKYACLYPEGQIDQLSSVSLQAYAFRD
jgi:hypothetical protein